MEATSLTSREATLPQVGVLRKRTRMGKPFWMKLAVFAATIILALDTAYRSYNGITYLNRGECILYKVLPRLAFLLYENIVELLLVVIVAVFAASLVGRYFLRFRRLIPRHPLGAFLWASLIPACSCSAIPMIGPMREKIPFRTIMTFIVAAPLLNPYIIMMSFTVLGVQYGILRILSSLILAVSTGYIAEFFQRRIASRQTPDAVGCGSNGRCGAGNGTVYEETFSVLRKIAPYLLAAGLLGIIIEVAAPAHILQRYDFASNPLGILLVILIGVPVYFCNGAEVLFLQPLMHYSGLPLEMAVAFSLTSTSICITSLILLIKFLGKRMTAVLLITIITMTFLLSVGIHFIPKWIL